jgi:serine-type D-Ala-D-Ala carboxypeptidase/endopeptidase (penicillin-binding protein 4)
MMKNYLILFLLTLTLCYFSNSEDIDEILALSNDIRVILNSDELEETHIGIEVWSLDNKKILFTQNSNLNFVPASLVKLFTSYGGLALIGADYSYETNLYMNGIVQKSGEIDGDLIVWSNGNPTHSGKFGKSADEIFLSWTSSLDSLGVSSVNGSIIGDMTYFDSNKWPLGWSWDDLQYDFGAEVQALNFNDNMARIVVSGGETPGLRAGVKIIPDNSFIKIINNVVTAENKYISEVDFYREFGSNVVELSGEIGFNRKKTIRKILNIGIENSGKYFLYNFRDYLLENNFIIRGGDIVVDRGSGLDLSTLTLINSQKSDSLGHIIKVMNTQSINLYAELLLKTIGKEKTGIGSFQKGLKQLNKFTKKIGIESGLELFDGSGLSRMNLMSPNAMIKLLVHAYESENRGVFVASLARPGRSGTLERRMKRRDAKNRIWAKTGSMTHVSNLCGYVKTESGEMLAFVMFFNNFTISSRKIRDLQDLICLRLASFNSKSK